MTKKTFMKNFREVANRFYWKVNAGNSLRGYLKGSNKPIHYCPITALVKVKTDLLFYDSNYVEAAQAIGLDLDDARNIADAADNNDLCKNAQLRRSLLKSTRAKGAEIKL